MNGREIYNKLDGHIWYVVASDGTRRAVMGIIFLEKYDELSEWRGSPGLYFVRDAAADETGQHGDPTVHEGWAMYCWDAYFKDHNGGWRKVAEQESVDGPWGIDERILKMLVRRTEFNAKMAEVDGRLDDLTERVQNIESIIEAIQKAIDDLNKKSHEHLNKSTLDALEEKNGQLTFKGTPISGNCYLYDNLEDGKIVWYNEKGEKELLDASHTLASNFAATAMAWLGMTLEVAEADGSISKYMMVADFEHRSPKHLVRYREEIKSNREFISVTTMEDETKIEKIITKGEALVLFDNPIPGTELMFTEPALKAIHTESVVTNAVGGVTYVEVLPEASVTFDERGLWCPITEDGTHTPFRLYRSKFGAWVDVAQENGEGQGIDLLGAKFDLVFCEDDPVLPFKKVHLFWTEPEDRSLYDHPIRWAKTTLVRKAGSYPRNVEDGTIVRVITDRETGSKGIIDNPPFSHEPVFYRLFSESTAGARYIPTSEAEGKYLEWTDVFKLIKSPLCPKIIKVGDTIVTPIHPVFGAIPCEVISVTSEFVRIASQDILAKMAYGESNVWDTSDLKTWLDKMFTGFSKYKVCEERQALEGKSYFVFDKDEGYKPLTIEAGHDFPEGVEVYEPETGALANGVFSKIEIPTAFSVGFQYITKQKSFNHSKESMDWWTSTATVGNLVITGNNTYGTAPTTELGAVVVFEIPAK